MMKFHALAIIATTPSLLPAAALRLTLSKGDDDKSTFTTPQTPVALGHRLQFGGQACVYAFPEDAPQQLSQRFVCKVLRSRRLNSDDHKKAVREAECEERCMQELSGVDAVVNVTEKFPVTFEGGKSARPYRETANPHKVTGLVERTEAGLVVERMRGGDLMDALIDHTSGKTVLSTAVKAKIIYDILSGLEALDERKLVHADLNLENVMLTAPLAETPSAAQVQAKLIDLGAVRLQSKTDARGARVLCDANDTKFTSDKDGELYEALQKFTDRMQQEPAFTDGGMPNGAKLGWASPERCAGNRVLSGKEDVFMLGLIAWALLAGDGNLVFFPDAEERDAKSGQVVRRKYHALEETQRWGQLRRFDAAVGKRRTLAELFTAMRKGPFLGDFNYEEQAKTAAALPTWAHDFVRDALECVEKRPSANKLMNDYRQKLKEAYENEAEEASGEA